MELELIKVANLAGPVEGPEGGVEEVLLYPAPGAGAGPQLNRVRCHL